VIEVHDPALAVMILIAWTALTLYCWGTFDKDKR
jgi:hypothetical protein